MDEFSQGIASALGVGEAVHHLGVPAMMLRALVVYAVALVVVRVGHSRFMGRNTAFDLILAIMLGSVMSRAITGQSPLLPTIAASLVLILAHALLSELAFRVKGFGRFVKGMPVALVRDGEIDWRAMRRTAITLHDLEEAVRMRGHEHLADVRLAMLERNGSISVIA